MSLLPQLLAGLLGASLFLAGAGLGAAVWRLIGRLTGGAWSEAAGLDRLARLAPIPVLATVVAAAALHVWIAPTSGPAALWQGAPATGVRLALIGATWLWIAWLSGRRASRALSGVALLVFGLSVSVAAFDMVLSLEPGWVSSAEGMALAVRMLGSAAAATLLLDSGGGDPAATRLRRDLAGLLAATLLATAYLSLMSYLIPWYGDLPDKTAWIRLRAGAAWKALIICAIGCGAVVPLPLMALSPRLGERAMRWAAMLALAGFLGQTIWLTAPPFGPLAAGAAVAVGGAGALLAAWRRGAPERATHVL